MDANGWLLVPMDYYNYYTHNKSFSENLKEAFTEIILEFLEDLCQIASQSWANCWCDLF